MKEYIKDYAPWLVVVFMFLYLFVWNPKQSPAEVGDKQEVVYVDRIVKIPEIVGSVNNPNPTLVVTNDKSYDPRLLEYFKRLENVEQMTAAYKDAIEIRKYKNTYASDKDSTVIVTVEDSVSGKLLNQKMSFKVKEREFKYQEKIINNYIKPKFIISAGGTVNLPTNPLHPGASVGGVIGLKNKSGYSLDIGYNTNQQINVTLKKDILTLWGKQTKPAQ